MDKDKVYLVVNKKATLDIGKDLLVKDVASVFASNIKTKELVENTKLRKKLEEEDWGYITAIDITQKIIERFPKLELVLLGEVETLLEYKSREQKRPSIEFIKVLIVSILLFFGSALAIINFHEDVNTAKTMKDIYYLFTGEKKDNPLLMVIPYSFGIGIGAITFFSRIFSSSKRRKKEPGPMEIELYLYDEDLEDRVLNDIKKASD